MGISPLPRDANFGNFHGHVIAEVWVQDDYEETDYRFFIQHIRWDDGSESIRFAYYTKPHGTDDTQWNYANRPPNMERETVRELIRRARQTDWFGA